MGIGDTLYLNVLRSDQLAFAQTLGVTADPIHDDPQANSDHAPFAWAGIPAVYFDMHYVGGHACGPDYHTSGDTADKLELAALQRAGSALVTAVETLSDQAVPRPIWQLYLPLMRTSL